MGGRRVIQDGDDCLAVDQDANRDQSSGDEVSNSNNLQKHDLSTDPMISFHIKVV